MLTDSYLKYVLSDNHSFDSYFRLRKPVSVDDIKRALLVRVRGNQYAVPDHYYRLGLEASFNGIERISEIFTKGVPNLACEFLDIHEGAVYVKGCRLNEWQMMLPLIPPLFLVTARLWKEYHPLSGDMAVFAHDFLLPSIRTTAIPRPFIPDMERLLQEESGLADLHIHLNGTLETDLAWGDFLRYPEAVYKYLREAFRDGNVREQWLQLTDVKDPLDFLSLFRIAGLIRDRLVEKAATGNNSPGDNMSFGELLSYLAECGSFKKIHPLAYLFGGTDSPLICDALLYFLVLDYLALNPDDEVTAGLFHYYLLILGLCNRLLVQQPDAFGFEQFRKYTSNKLREKSEESFERRFMQLSGNSLGNIRHIEGRFSPKSDLQGNVKAIDSIRHGFSSFLKEQKRSGMPESTLNLTAHFIKKCERRADYQDVRFHALRKEAERKANALIALIRSGSRQAALVSGIDAAASEFDTPPEVFAPAFRSLRAAGFSHFTYHAGEDFYHVLSGLRAIYEAVEFLNMREGDRIGHAVASGVDVDLWRENIGESMLIRKEEYLDDLVFAYFVISETGDDLLMPLLPIIALRVRKYAAEIYSESIGVDVADIYSLIEAWKLRAAEPAFEDRASSLPERLCHAYHQSAVRLRGEEVIRVKTYDIFGRDGLIRMQHLILRHLHQRQIVIETLPTSNVMIGHHHGFDTYHLWNWYRWSVEGKAVPPIVVGTDDAGIFATNIYNEYCHIYSLLVFTKGVSSYEAMNYIRHLVHNSKVYAFR